MQTYIAFLRGINVGSHNVKMARLRNIFIDLGLNNVRSYINSGNIFFSTNSSDREELTSKIEAKLNQTLGYEVPTFIRTVDELENIVSQKPFTNIELTNDIRFCVLFTQEKIDNNLKLPLISSKNDMDIIATNPTEAFIVWHIINGRPPSGKFTEGTIPAKNTLRYYHTLIKILNAVKS